MPATWRAGHADNLGNHVARPLDGHQVAALKGAKMRQVSCADLRKNLAHYMDEASDGRAPILATRQGGKGNVVLLSEDEFEGWKETEHILRSPANASRLLTSVGSAKAGRTEESDPIAKAPVKS